MSNVDNILLEDKDNDSVRVGDYDYDTLLEYERETIYDEQLALEEDLKDSPEVEAREEDLEWREEQYNQDKAWRDSFEKDVLQDTEKELPDWYVVAFPKEMVPVTETPAPSNRFILLRKPEFMDQSTFDVLFGAEGRILPSLETQPQGTVHANITMNFTLVLNEEHIKRI